MQFMLRNGLVIKAKIKDLGEIQALKQTKKIIYSIKKQIIFFNVPMEL